MARAFVEEDEQAGSFASVVGEATAVICSDAFEQAVGFHFAKVIAQLSEGISIVSQIPVQLRVRSAEYCVNQIQERRNG